MTEEELQRLVLDVHDGPVQHIFASLSQLSLVRARIAAVPEALAAAEPGLGHAVHMLELALLDLRAMLTAFHAPEFADKAVAEIAEDRTYYFEGQHMAHLCKEELPFESKARLAAGGTGLPDFATARIPNANDPLVQRLYRGLPKEISPYRIDFPNLKLKNMKSVRMKPDSMLVPASADPVIGVLMIPGQTVVTPIRCGASSCRSASEKPKTPNLVVA